MIYVLWGFNPRVVNEPIKLTSGSMRHCKAEGRAYGEQDWTTAIYSRFVSPDGLRLIAEARS